MGARATAGQFAQLSAHHDPKYLLASCGYSNRDGFSDVAVAMGFA